MFAWVLLLEWRLFGLLGWEQFVAKGKGEA